MPKSMFDPPKKTVVRKKIKDQEAREAQAYLRRRRREQIAAAEDRAYKRKQGKRSR